MSDDDLESRVESKQRRAETVAMVVLGSVPDFCSYSLPTVAMAS